jgi:hypothetical protein
MSDDSSTTVTPIKQKRIKANVNMHYKRVTGQIQVIQPEGAQKQEPISISAIMNDLSSTRVEVFTTSNLSPRQTIKLILTDSDTSIENKGSVQWSKELIETSVVFGRTPFRYKMCIDFKYDTAEDAKKSADFFKALGKAEVVAEPKAA